jgi:hypothetical protein
MDCTRSKVKRATQGVGPLRESVRTRHESRIGVKDLDGGQPRYPRKQRLIKLQLESTGRVIRTYGKTTGVEIAKRIAGLPVGLQKFKDRTMLMGRLPSKWKRNCKWNRSR